MQGEFAVGDVWGDLEVKRAVRGEGFSPTLGTVLLDQLQQLVGVSGICCVLLFDQPEGSFCDGAGVIDPGVAVVVLVPAANEVIDASLQGREVQEGVSNGVSTTVKELFGDVTAASAFETEVIVGVRGDVFAKSSLQGPLSSDQFREFGACFGCSVADTDPIVADLVGFIGNSGAIDGLELNKGFGVGVLLQVLPCSDLMRQFLVVLCGISEANNW